MSAADGLGPLPVGAVYTRALGSVGAAMYTYTADQMRAYAAEQVAAERERIRFLVEAVRDANAASQDADDCLIYTPAVERAWLALLAGLAGPTAPGPAP